MTHNQLPAPPQPQQPAQHPQTPQDPHSGPTSQRPSQGPSRTAKTIMYITAVAGGVALLGIAASAAYSAAGTRLGTASGDSSRSVSVEGVTELDLDISLADFTLKFGAVDEAQLKVSGTDSDRWALKRDRDTLVVTSPQRLGGSSCLFGFCPPDRAAHTTVILTLPETLERQSVNAEIDVSVGSFTSTGTFGDLAVEVGTGEATVAGDARTLSVSVGVGSFSGDLTGVNAADFEVSMGDVRTTLRGDAPDSVDVEVGTGSADLQLPDVEYRVDASVELGDLRNQLRTSSSAPNRITADVSLGDLALRPLR